MIGQRDRIIDDLAARVLGAIPATEPTLPIYSTIKNAWYNDDELLCYPFPIIALCRHEGHQHYLREAYSPTMALHVWDKIQILIPPPELRPEFYEVRNS